jgi:hypothetical protein
MGVFVGFAILNIMERRVEKSEDVLTSVDSTYNDSSTPCCLHH